MQFVIRMSSRGRIWAIRVEVQLQAARESPSAHHQHRQRRDSLEFSPHVGSTVVSIRRMLSLVEAQGLRLSFDRTARAPRRPRVGAVKVSLLDNLARGRWPKTPPLPET
eukprot:5685274-Prymnesium_polylepis.1